IAAVLAMRERRAEILAIYHSHPRWEAIPSKTDLRENHYGPVPRIIVSLLEEVPVVRVWRLDPDSYEELPWQIVAAEGPGRTPAAPPLEVAIAPGPNYTTGHRPMTTNPARSLSSMQRTLIIFKPDCVQRRLVGEILRRFEAKGLRFAALKLMQVDRARGEKHYAEHRGKPFFDGLIGFITGGPVIVGVPGRPQGVSRVGALGRWGGCGPCGGRPMAPPRPPGPSAAISRSASRTP